MSFEIHKFEWTLFQTHFLKHDRSLICEIKF